MSEFKTLLVVSAMASQLAFAGDGLEQAEVRLPYGELKSLLSGAVRPLVSPKPDPALLGARFRLSMANGKPVMEATFRATTFADGLVKVPLAGGDLTVVSQQPPEARILIHDEMLCMALDKSGSQVLELGLHPGFGPEGAAIVVPPCPAAIFETGDLGNEWSASLRIDGQERLLRSNQLVALPIGGGRHFVKLLGGEEAREALRPPESSSWTWQNQALVIPGDGEIDYRVLCRASASGGSGVSAVLDLPADARDAKVTGDDLVSQKLVRGADRMLELHIDWKTRGQLEREVAVFYSLPRRPLDRIWKLQAPAGPEAKSNLTRFILVGSPDLTYAADGLTGPFPPKGLPAGFSDDLDGAACYQLESETAVELTVNPLPVVATAEATIPEALWMIRIEPDGAMLIEGSMAFEHRGMLGVPIDVPSGMTLLSCDVGGLPLNPVNLGNGKIEVRLPSSSQKTRISLAFTGRTTAIDPVEGTLALSLPMTPLFIRTLTWKIDLPRGYQAETSGNLIRATEPGDPPSRMTLRKNLCRDERPEANVFYQRSDLKN